MSIISITQELAKNSSTISFSSASKRFKEWSKENVKTRTARSRTREGNSVRLELIPRPENFPINSNRFLSLQYANEDRLKIALSSISNGALVCFTCVASNSILKRQTFALNMTNEEKKK
ncbi:hypothetical protein T06_12713 [Trichinella sp. T6]|nr:hypothetical protein T06_12713 [Trichinella sp. T6]